MKASLFVTPFVNCLLFIATLVEGARILAIIPTPSYSHQVLYRPIWIDLCRRGHEVILLTTHPINDRNLTNLMEINFISTYYHQEYDFVKNKFIKKWIHQLRFDLWNFFHYATEKFYEHPLIRKIYAVNSDEKFDVILVEIFMTPGIYALAHRLNTPIIGITSMELLSINHYLLGASVMPSHPSTWEMEADAGWNLSLWQRVRNFIKQWHHLYCEMNDFMVKQQAIAEKYLGKNISNIADLHRNISIVLYGQDQATSFVRPRASNVISIGSIHVSKEPAPLPIRLKEFLQDAPNGFIYVSLGTNVRFSSFPKHIIAIFRDVLTNLPCKVLWKSDTIFPDMPDHILIDKWFPQQSVLAHPKIRLFVYQGGLQSTQEAVNNAVPLVGIPILGDQEAQINRMVTLGVAKGISVLNFSKQILNTSITDILNDSRYKERMLKLKALVHDKPYGDLEKAIWWIEFVIRHKGAPHLHNAMAYDPWYQRDNMDVIAFLTIVSFVILLCALFVIYKLLLTIANHVAKRRVILDKKQN